MTCRFAHLDGAYVLGSLSPAERLEFEAHLPGCAECSRAVRELAGLPGLLAQVDVADLEVPTPDAPLPPTLLPALVREVRGEQRRRSVLTAAVAAAVAAVFVSALAIGGAFDRSTPTTSATSPRAHGQPHRRARRRGDGAGRGRAGEGGRRAHRCGVGHQARPDLLLRERGDRWTASTTARTAVGLRAWSCTPARGPSSRWRPGRPCPGRTMRLTGATATGRTDITTVEVRTTDGRVVLTLAQRVVGPVAGRRGSWRPRGRDGRVVARARGPACPARPAATAVVAAQLVRQSGRSPVGAAVPRRAPSRCGPPPRGTGCRGSGSASGPGHRAGRGRRGSTTSTPRPISNHSSMPRSSP